MSNDPELYKVYPAGTTLLYNGLTILHFTFGGLGLFIIGGRLGVLTASIYLGVAFWQMYIAMPRMVCRHCVYARMKGARCVSGMNRRVPRDMRSENSEKFRYRAGGLSHNKLYMGSLLLPIPLLAIALIFKFDYSVLAILISLLFMFLFRVGYLFRTKVCIHCYAKYDCPNAKMMGLA